MPHMENDYRTISKLIWQGLHIPVYLYTGDLLLVAVPNEQSAILPYHYVRDIITQAEPIYYTKYGTCFARLDLQADPNTYFILGPIATLPYDQRILEEMFLDYGVSVQQKEDFRNHFRSLPTMTYLDFFYKLNIVCYMLNGKPMPFSFFTQAPTETDTRDLRQKQVDNMYAQKEDSVQNNSYQIEKALLSLIRTGNVTGLQQFISAAPNYQAGVVAGDHQRLQKNYFISTVTLATRAAIEGGLPVDQAYRLSDLYISKVETLHSPSAINTLFMQALSDFTVQVNAMLSSQRRITVRDSNQAIQDCMDYVQKHTHRPLSVQSVADALGYHRSYLSTIFKKSTGIQLNDYIYQCKLEESKHLLAYTTKKIGEISDALCFSNQSHFVQRFKKLYGISPNEYRSACHIT